MMILVGIVLLIGCIRLVRWLAIVQQKEYRWDRVRLFLFSAEGLRELVRIFPRANDFSRTGLKRPKITGRICVVAAISVFTLVYLSMLIVGWIGQQEARVENTAMLQLFILLAGYISLPVVVMASSIPTAILSYFQTTLTLLLARRKFNQTKPLVIGITGSYGKTATKQLLAHLLSSKQPVFVTPKSYNTRYSIARSILQHYHSEKVVVLEYGAYSKGEIAKLAKWFRPSVAIITGFTSQHLGLFGSQQAIIQAKSELIAALPSDGVVVYNSLNEGVQKIVKMGVKKWQNKQGRKEGLTIISCNPELSQRKYRYLLSKDGYLQIQAGKHLVQTRLVGLQHAETVEMAITVAMNLGELESFVLKSLSLFEPSDNYMKFKQTKVGTIIVDDSGTSNPMGFRVALDLLQHISAEKKLLVTAGIVDLGNESKTIHTALAIQSKHIATNVLFVGWSGRSEFQAVIGEKCITDRSRIAEILLTLTSKDAVLIEGRMPGWFVQILKQL